MGKFEIKCIDCKSVFQDKLLKICPKCGGMIDFFYDLNKVKIGDSTNPNIKYFDLIPIIDERNLVEVTNITTPLIHAKSLGKMIGHDNIFLKNETVHPTKTTKDRMATIGLSFFKENGVKEFVITSTGNSSTSYAVGVLGNEEFNLNILIGKEFFGRLNFPNNERIKVHVVDKDFVGTGKEAKKFAEKNNLRFEGGAFNPARREGLKLAYLEAFDQLGDSPDYIFQSVSSGMGLIGAHKGILEYLELGILKKMPKIFCCQQKSCNPMVRAYNDESSVISEKHIINNPEGLAKAILRGDPTKTYPYLYKIVQESHGGIVDATLDEMKEAMHLAKVEGVEICYASAVALACAIKLIRNGEIKKDKKIIINLSGGIRK